jgi:hypothetical protein
MYGVLSIGAIGFDGIFGLSRLGLFRLVLTYFFSHNTIQSNNRVLFILPVEQAQPTRFVEPEAAVVNKNSEVDRDVEEAQSGSIFF